MFEVLVISVLYSNAFYFLYCINNELNKLHLQNVVASLVTMALSIAYRPNVLSDLARKMYLNVSL